MKNPTQFYNNYAKNIAPKMEKLEKERIKYLTIFVAIPIVSALSSILFAGPFILAIISAGGNSLQASTLLFGLAILAFSIIPPTGISYLIISKIFSKKIKTSCMKNILDTFDNLTLSNNGLSLISDYDICRSQLFESYNTRQDDDCFLGSYKDTEFKIIETSLLNVKTYNRKRRYDTVFKGIILSFYSHKTIKGQTVITSKRDYSTRGKLQKVTLEDAEFNKKYNISATDQIESRYLITTSFMERFKNLHTAFGSANTKCSFFDDKVIFAIPTSKNLFELGNLFCSLKNQEPINQFYKEITAVYDIIDYFKLAEKTGL